MLLKDKFIFIVEDNTQNRVVFQMILIRQGARVEFERWGRDTLRRLKALKNIDIIVMDLGLAQGVSGYDLFDDIRAIPEFSQLPIVAVSATDPAVGIPKTRSKGFNGFIAKPIDDVRFPRQLAKIIAGDEVWDTGIAVLEDESE